MPSLVNVSGCIEKLFYTCLADLSRPLVEHQARIRLAEGKCRCNAVACLCDGNGCVKIYRVLSDVLRILSSRSSRVRPESDLSRVEVEEQFMLVFAAALLTRIGSRLKGTDEQSE